MVLMKISLNCAGLIRRRIRTLDLVMEKSNGRKNK